MPSISMTYPRPGTLQVTRSRKWAAFELAKRLVACAACFSALAWGLFRAGRRLFELGTADWEAFTILYLVCLAVGLSPLVWLAETVEQARLIVGGPVLVFCCDGRTIGRSGKCVARFEDVAHVEMATSLARWDRAQDVALVLKNGKRLGICCSTRCREAGEVAESLAQMLGVPVLLTLKDTALRMGL